MFVTVTYDLTSTCAVVVQIANDDEWFAFSNVLLNLVRSGVECSMSTNSDQSGLDVISVEDFEARINAG